MSDSALKQQTQALQSGPYTLVHNHSDTSRSTMETSRAPSLYSQDTQTALPCGAVPRKCPKGVQPGACTKRSPSVVSPLTCLPCWLPAPQTTRPQAALTPDAAADAEGRCYISGAPAGPAPALERQLLDVLPLPPPSRAGGGAASPWVQLPLWPSAEISDKATPGTVCFSSPTRFLPLKTALQKQPS